MKVNVHSARAFVWYKVGKIAGRWIVDRSCGGTLRQQRSRIMNRCLSLVVLGVAALSVIGCAKAPMDGSADAGMRGSVQGNWVLEYRELPDGKKVMAPEVGGMLIYTK